MMEVLYCLSLGTSEPPNLPMDFFWMVHQGFLDPGKSEKYEERLKFSLREWSLSLIPVTPIL